jgi:phosphoribosylaminoimidazolecarboxamide formyltransferase/IMP cyclohydrolase
MHSNLEVQIKRALISVSNKDGLDPLVRALCRYGVEVIASGGTAQAIKAMGVAVTPIENFTGNPEAFDGRMKTLSFRLESALLYDRTNAKHVKEAENLGVPPIDLVACNFYPFEKAAASHADFETLIDEVDIGGPTMVRAAAKNHKSVTVLVDPADYAALIDELNGRQGRVSYGFRRDMMLKAFRHVLDYDRAIYDEFSRQTQSMAGRALRYGENPHQKASFCLSGEAGAVDWSGVDGGGLALSYNNVLDAEAAFGACRDLYHFASTRFTETSTGSAKTSDEAKSKTVATAPIATVIVKHQNPCGMALASTIEESLELAWAGDPISAFGGIVAFSAPVTASLARQLDQRFLEVILAPDFTEEALALLRAKKKNLRLLRIRSFTARRPRILMAVEGGMLEQEPDDLLAQGRSLELQAVTDLKFDARDQSLALFTMTCAKWIKSNAIALGRCVPQRGGYQLVAMGSGQPNRIDAISRLAIPKAMENLKKQGLNAESEIKKCLLASDAFFPFVDSIEEIAKWGIGKVVQPGGSKKDPEVIAAANALKVAMAFTGVRHFRH